MTRLRVDEIVWGMRAEREGATQAIGLRAFERGSVERGFCARWLARARWRQA